MEIAIIGAGAAGCFCAVNLKRALPDSHVTVFESGKHPLAKVALTGGGRCNLTNSFEAISSLDQAYPRGTNLMKRALKQFSQKDTWEWFENEGVDLVLQEDNCVFPASQDAMQIVRTLTGRMRQLGVRLKVESKVESISSEKDHKFRIEYTSEGRLVSEEFDYAVVTTGGSPKKHGLSFLSPLNLEYIDPVPSLFTFNIPLDPITSLQGAVVENVTTGIPGTKFRANGPLLITDWGMSGPAILKLSSYAARFLSENQYVCDLTVNWFGEKTDSEVREYLEKTAKQNPQKKLSSIHPEFLSSRLWSHLLLRSGLREDIKWAEVGKKGFNKLSNTLSCDTFHIKGRGRFKEEFVTCGGVSLSNISISTLESKTYPGLYFAGEVLDVDAITGGFNLQAAWSMGYIIAKNISVSVHGN